MKIMKSSNLDSFNLICKFAEKRFKEIPKPIKWIEPSINMLYLESISSFIFGNYYSSIMSMSSLLEHILRLALYDSKNSGRKRTVTINKLDSLGMISELIIKAAECGLIEESDVDWWNQIAKLVRNKSAHYLLPKILKEFNKENYDKNDYKELYIPEGYRVSENETGYDWGFFYHRADYFISKQFIGDSTKYINKIINKTEWEADRSWWISQENMYNKFFEYKWTKEEMGRSLQKLYAN